MAIGDTEGGDFDAAPGDVASGPTQTPPTLATGDTVTEVDPDCCCGGCSCQGQLSEGCATVSALKLTDAGGDTTDWTPDGGFAASYSVIDTSGFDAGLIGATRFVSPSHAADIFGRQPRLTVTTVLFCDLDAGVYKLTVTASLSNDFGSPTFNCGGGCAATLIHFSTVITLTGFDCTTTIDTGVLTLTAQDSGCSTCVLQLRVVLDPNTPC